MEELSQDRIHERIKALDDAFLFVISSTSIVFAILQVVMVGRAAFVWFAPLLIAGVAYPFYVGYLRGAILYDNRPLERVRGWLCFAVSATYYSIFTLAVLAQVYIPNILYLGPEITIVATVLCCFVAIGVVRWFFSLTNYRASESEMLLLGATGFNAIMFSFSTFFLAIYLSLWVQPSGPFSIRSAAPPPYLPQLAGLFMLFPPCLGIERVIQQVTSRNWTLRLPRSSTEPEPDIRWKSLYRLLVGSAYTVAGWMQCLLIGASSDKLAAIAYVISFVLACAVLNGLPAGYDATATTATALFSVFASWRFLVCQLKMKTYEASDR